MEPTDRMLQSLALGVIALAIREANSQNEYLKSHAHAFLIDTEALDFWTDILGIRAHYLQKAYLSKNLKKIIVWPKTKKGKEL